MRNGKTKKSLRKKRSSGKQRLPSNLATMATAAAAASPRRISPNENVIGRDDMSSLSALPADSLSSIIQGTAELAGHAATSLLNDNHHQFAARQLQLIDGGGDSGGGGGGDGGTMQNHQRFELTYFSSSSHQQQPQQPQQQPPTHSHQLHPILQQQQQRRLSELPGTCSTVTRYTASNLPPTGTAAVTGFPGRIRA